jgi:hypothetical protein
MKLLRRIDHFMHRSLVLDRLTGAIRVGMGFFAGYFCGLGLL